MVVCGASSAWFAGILLAALSGAIHGDLPRFGVIQAVSGTPEGECLGGDTPIRCRRRKGTGWPPFPKAHAGNPRRWANDQLASQRINPSRRPPDNHLLTAVAYYFLTGEPRLRGTR